MSTGTLYVVATPIGNLGDVTRRAVETLEACPVVAAEDTRHTQKLLAHLGVTRKVLLSLHQHSSQADVRRVLDRLAAGEDVALVSDAGTPLVSDPGAELVAAAADAGVRVVPIPGPSAVLAALVASGLGGGPFRFEGFLPRDGSARAAALLRVANEPAQVVLFEAPGRIAATLGELAAATPTRTAAVARELTKLHEEVVRGPLATLAAAARERDWLGEIVLVLGPYDAAGREAAIDDDALDRAIDEGLAAGTHARSLADRLAAWSGRPRRDVYQRVVARKR